MLCKIKFVVTLFLQMNHGKKFTILVSCNEDLHPYLFRGIYNY